MTPFRVEKRESAPFTIFLQGADLIAPLVDSAKQQADRAEAARAAMVPLEAKVDRVNATFDPTSQVDIDREYQVDATGAKGSATAADGALVASAFRAARSLIQRMSTQRLSLVDRFGKAAGGFSLTTLGASAVTGDANGATAITVGTDGVVEVSALRADRITLRRALLSSIALVDRLGRVAGGMGAIQSSAAGVIGDATGVIAQTVAADGSSEIPALRVDRAVIRRLQTLGLGFVDRLGKSLGGIEVAQIADKVAVTADAGGRLAESVRGDGMVEIGALSPSSVQGAGGRLAAGGGYLVESKMRPTGKREIVATDLATGVRRRLSADTSADFLDPQILPVAPAVPVSVCVCTKRIGGSERLVALPLTGSGIEAPVHPSPSILFHGDSFLNHPMAPTIVAGLNVRRPYVVINSGGSWLEAAVARLAGGRVAASKVGNVPAAAGGVQDGSDYVYPGVPQYWAHTYVHIEGGYEDIVASPDPATAVAGIIARFRQLRATLTPAVRRILIAQSGIDRLSTPEQVAFKLACDALIAAAFPAEWVGTYDYIRANGTGSMVGPNGGQVWPADAYGDNLHPSSNLTGAATQTGFQLYAAPIIAALNARNF